PPENVAQSGLRIRVSGLGTSVTLLRLRSDEQAPTAATSAAAAPMRQANPINRCIAVPRSADIPTLLLSSQRLAAGARSDLPAGRLPKVAANGPARRPASR